MVIKTKLEVITASSFVNLAKLTSENGLNLLFLNTSIRFLDKAFDLNLQLGGFFGTDESTD